MDHPKIYFVNMPEELAQDCLRALPPAFRAAAQLRVSAADFGAAKLVSETAGLALVFCRAAQEIDLIRRAAADCPTVALVESFEPGWVNRLLAAGAEQVIPRDQLQILSEYAAELAARLAAPLAETEEVDELRIQIQQILGAHNLLESILSNIPALLVVMDLEGRIVFFNHTCEMVSGYTQAEVQNRRLADIFLLPEEKQGVLEAMERIKAGDYPLNYQNGWFTRDGQVRQIAWINNSALVDGAGKVRFIVGMGQDITDETQRQAELLELENRFERIFHASPVGIGLLRYRDIAVIDVNDSFLRIFDRERDQVIGQPADQIGLFPEQGARDFLEVVARQGVLRDREWRVTAKGRKPIFVLVSLELIEWAHELAVLVMVRDISDRVESEDKIRRLNEDLERRILERTRALEAVNREKKAEVEYRKAIENSSQRLTQIIWESPDIICICEPGGRIQYLNKAGRLLLGLDETEPVARYSVYEMYPADLIPRVVSEVVPQVNQLGSWKGEIELEIQRGARFPVSQTILAHQDHNGAVVFFSTIIRDITEEKRAAEQIRLAYQTEKEMSRLRTSFFSMTSHQFRTPLSTILSSAELLEHYATDWDTPRRMLHLRRIEEQAQTMNEMLNDILVVGRLEMKADEVVREPLDICKIVERCLRSCEAADGGNHRLVLNCGVDQAEVFSARRVIDRVVENLLSNAVKYSPAGSVVTVNVLPAEEQVVIEVIDQGIGIPPEELTMLGEPFFRAGNTSEIPGSGLGLMIVRRMLDLIGGDYSIESELEHGTRVQVRIPSREAQG